MRLAAPSRVGSDSVYDYIIAEMSKAVKKQVLCIASCYFFAQSGSKDIRQRRRRAGTPVTEHARPTPCERVHAAPVKARRPGVAARVRRAAKNRSLQKKGRKVSGGALGYLVIRKNGLAAASGGARAA